MSHLTDSDRLQIEHGLHRQMSLQQIARKLGKSHSTISREVLKHRVDSDKGAVGRITNRCVFRRNCEVYNLCPGRRCQRKCSTCRNCNAVCPKFQEDICRKLSIPPYVCNGCPEEHKCVLKKKFYHHATAQQAYQQVLLESRKGANLTETERAAVSAVIHVGIQKGQSVHHIMSSNKDLFTVCEKTVYRYVNAGIIRTKRGDMPRSCMMKPRKRKSLEHKVDSKCRINRTHDDFNQYREAHPDTPVVEIDSVIGRVGGKVLLTMHFNNCGLMLAFLRNANNSQSVIDVFNMMEKLFSLEIFTRLFPVMLTDNGSEFSNPTALETSSISGTQRTRIFYCNPYSSWQKGHVENNHLNLRKVLSKGRSFENFTQTDINLMLSHVNSFARKSLNDVPAITLFETIYGKEILGKLGITLISPNAVCLLPELISK
ncbi:MAG: IS30 family transposase [Lentisphaerae bacterium]|nr:IS30 family transposase [Lentisphaerota bacterium]